MPVEMQTYKPITYKGHGMLEKASSFNANAHVVNHERHHLQQYRAIAQATGKEVVSENITIQYRFVDGKLIPVKGEATAVLKDKEQKPDILDLEFKNKAEADKNQIKAASNSPQHESGQKIDRIGNRIETQLEKIKAKISELKSEEESSFKLASLENKERQLEQIKSKIESLKSRSEMESSSQALSELLDKIGKELTSPEKLLEAIMGVKTGQTENDTDSNSSHASMKNGGEAYDRNMDYSLQALAMSAAWVA
jgi:hypothetical protein